MDEKTNLKKEQKCLLPLNTVKRIMKKADNSLWLPEDTVNLMRELAEDYIRMLTAKTVLVARNSNIKNRVRKKDLEIIGGIT